MAPILPIAIVAGIILLKGRKSPATFQPQKPLPTAPDGGINAAIDAIVATGDPATIASSLATYRAGNVGMVIAQSKAILSTPIPYLEGYAAVNRTVARISAPTVGPGFEAERIERNRRYEEHAEYEESGGRLTFVDWEEQRYGGR